MFSGVYIHIPFCGQNCKYCHFVTVPYDIRVIEKYLAGVVKEIALYAESSERRPEVDSIYIGGGTPSLLPADSIAEILESCRNHFNISADCEISLEANPGTLDFKKLQIYGRHGINRISLGVQSFHNRELEFLGRLHNVASVMKSAEMLKANGFTNINLDLLLGIPLQTPKSWKETMRRIPETGFSHVSVYMLDLDEPCQLSRAVSDGSVAIAGDDTIAALYLETIDVLASYGYRQYEISNFAQTGYACRHNLKYWLREPVIGFGLASHSFDGHSRYANYSKMPSYFEALDASRLPVEWGKTLGEKDSLSEILFLGLRLAEGIQWNEIQRRYRGGRLQEYENVLREMADAGLVEWKDFTVRLRPKGMLLSNEIFQKFV